MPTPPPRQQPSFTIVAPRIHPYATADGEENDDDEGYTSVARASITHDEDISPLTTRSECAMCMDNDTKRSTTPDDKYAFTTKC